ncbi:MAG TPA: trypsin-like serine protease [Acidimicrobiales bacterium]|nr:trypsin-like serine protease [Acidimicrobiales bacterium]
MALLAPASPAGAIANGRADGQDHPNVGALIAEWRTPGQKEILCSGTLIAPRVFLTAAHCTSYLESLGIARVWVTFDATYDSRSTLVAGTMHTEPEYRRRQGDPHDLAVVVLERDIAGVALAQLPTAGAFDDMDLRGQTFTAVGYGKHEPTREDGGKPTQTAPLVREQATASFTTSTATWLKMSQNDAHGWGGTCKGDSGGPNFLGSSNLLAATTITGDTYCKATNVAYRLDTPSARRFLGRYVDLP